jgi:hypothetical protein
MTVVDDLEDDWVALGCPSAPKKKRRSRRRLVPPAPVSQRTTVDSAAQVPPEAPLAPPVAMPATAPGPEPEVVRQLRAMFEHAFRTR